MLPFFDTHAHLSMLNARGTDARARLRELFANGFEGIVDVGTEADDLPSRVAAFSEFPGVAFSAGIWPSAEAIRDRRALAEILSGLVRADRSGALVAIGECGFDRHWNRPEDGKETSAYAAGERELFDFQAELALALDLPLIIHSRDAADETAEAVESFKSRGLRGVVHCFSYGAAEARRFLDAGLYLSFAGTVTYKNAIELREAARFVPADRILAETDSPYLAPAPMRGKSSEPGMVEHTCRFLARLRETELSDFVETASGNARALFRRSD